MNVQQYILGIMLASAGMGCMIYAKNFYVDCPVSCPDEYEKPYLTWSGYINTESWFDTRQSVTKRVGNELLFPKPRRRDRNGVDINDHAQFGIIPFVVRLKGRLDGPSLLCSDSTYAFFSGDFRGINDEINPVFRFRKGYVFFDWGSKALLLGQDNHPLYVADCRPNTVAYSRAVPIDTRARVPQIRLIWRPNPCEDSPTDELWLTVFSHSRQTQSRGPAPLFASRLFIQRGVMPAFDAQWRKYLDEDTLWGIGVDFKRIVPRLETDFFDLVVDPAPGTETAEFKDSKGITSAILYTYLCHKTSDFILRTKGMYVHDGSEFGLISGYAVETEDPITKRRTYANLRSFSLWVDVDVCPESQVTPGILLAVARNFGSDKRLFRDEDGNIITFALAPDIRVLARIAPRIWYQCGPVSFGAEVEVTRAEFGELNDFGAPEFNTYAENNVRFLASIYYRF